MNTEQLAGKVYQLVKLAGKRKIWQRADKVSRELGQVKRTEHSCHTNYEADLNVEINGKTLLIHRSSGWSMFGGGDLTINWNDRKVFYATECQIPEKLTGLERCKLLKAGFNDIAVESYLPGEWEQYLTLSRLRRVMESAKRSREKAERKTERERIANKPLDEKENNTAQNFGLLKN
mgnify:FL=1